MFKKKAVVTRDGEFRTGIPENTIIEYDRVTHYGDCVDNIYDLETGESLGGIVSFTGKSPGVKLLLNWNNVILLVSVMIAVLLLLNVW
jgi:hypothetical protein